MTHSTPPLDQQARSDARDPHFNVTLEASAGTGKTRVLVDRYIQLIEAGASPRNILAITFTRKAAAEMKHRIIQELRTRHLLWAEVRERLFDVHISTMDAFCLGLLKEFPLEADLEPDVDLISDVELHRVLQEAVEYSLCDRRKPSTSDLTFLISHFGGASLRRGIRNFVQRRLVTGPLLHAFVRRQIPYRIELSNVLRKASTSLRDALMLYHWTTLPTSIRRVMDSRLVTPYDLEQVASYFLTKDGQSRTRLSNACRRAAFDTRADYDQHRTQVIGLGPVIAEHVRVWRRDLDLYAIQELWRLYQSAGQRFAILKEERGGLDFSDVVQRAANLLSQRGIFSQSRFRLESRYHHLLIDEFQDTNEMQWLLIQNLIDSWGEGAGLVQDAIANSQASGRGKGRLKDPSIFLVGDRKQSIYGWRDARVEVMNTAKAYLLKIRRNDGRTLHIRQSFRSRPALLQFLNDVFSGVPKAREDVSWAFRYRKSDQFPILDSDRSNQPVGLAIAATRVEAAAAVGDEIVRLLQEGEYQPKDIAVCFRSRTHYRVYEQVLTERGVPTYVYRGLGFYDSPEVRDVQAVIRYFANPISELRASEFLRSRFIGFSDTGLSLIAAQHQRRGRTISFVKLLKHRIAHDRLAQGLSSEDQVIISTILPKITVWLDLVDQIPPSDLLQRIIDEMDYAAFFVGRDGAQGWEDLKKVLEMIRRAQNRGYMTFARLAEYLDQASTGEESLAALETVDAVNLMTIHASKGLEFKAVFVVNLDQRLRTDMSLPRITEYADGTIDVSAMEKVGNKGLDRAREEEKRLLYVALTRAKDYLVLSALDAASNEIHATFINLLPKGLRELLPLAVTTDAQEMVWQAASGMHRLRVVRLATSPRYYRNSTMTSAQTLALEPLSCSRIAKTTVSQLITNPSGGGGENRCWKSFKTTLGTTVHRMFKYAVPIDKELQRVADTLLPDDLGQTPADRERAVHQATSLYTWLHEQQELTKLLQVGTVSREVPFVLTRGSQKIRGAIDTLVLLPNRAIVVDYKTGQVADSHRLQIEIYLESAQALFPERKVEGVIFDPEGVPRWYSL